jgi:hypothetical protein
MTGRILRIELRRSAAVWAAVISLPLASVWPQVAEGLTGVVGQHRSTLEVLVPLALGVGGWQARRDRRSRTAELLASTARPEWQRLLSTAGALGIGAATGYVVMFAGIAVYGATTGAYVPVVVMLAAAVMALCLAAAVWLGLAVGRAVPSVLIPPLLVVVGFVAMASLLLVTDTEGYTASPPPGTLLLDLSRSTGFEAFETLTASARLAQASWAIALAAACLTLCAATRRWRLAAAAPLALGLVVASAQLPRSLHDAITLDRGALALVCTPDEPRVCSRRMHPDVLDDLREPGQEALTILSAKLPQAPTAVVEAYYGNDTPVVVRPRPDVVYADFRPDGTGRVDATERDILWSLLMGAGTLPCPDAQAVGGPRYNAARLVAAAWLLEEEPPPPPDPDDPALPGPSLTGPAYDALLAMPAEEQRARITALRDAELACADGERLDILVGDRTPP